MYISPFIVLALLPAPDAPGEADFPAAGLSVDRIGGTSTCWIPFFAWIWALILAAAAAGNICQPNSQICNSIFPGHVPAAAAGSAPPFFAASGAGLSDALATGLLLRLDSVVGFRAGGERERLSNLETLFSSGSVWSKRERFAVRRSVSSMLTTK